MLRYAEAPYAHGIRKKTVRLRYVSAQNAHVVEKKKSRYVTQRRHMPTSLWKKKSRYVTQCRHMASSNLKKVSFRSAMTSYVYVAYRYGTLNLKKLKYVSLSFFFLLNALLNLEQVCSSVSFGLDFTPTCSIYTNIHYAFTLHSLHIHFAPPLWVYTSILIKQH